MIAITVHRESAGFLLCLARVGAVRPASGAGPTLPKRRILDMHRFSKTVCGLMAIALGTTTACGGDSTDPKANASLSPSEARVVRLRCSVRSPRRSVRPACRKRRCPHRIAIGADAHREHQCELLRRGHAQGTYLFTDGVNSTGTGTKSGSITVAASQCTVSTGERTISADGSYLYTFSADFTKNVQSSNFVWQAGGTLNWTGGSCTLDYTVEVTPQGARSFSGTVCRVDISGSGS